MKHLEINKKPHFQYEEKDFELNKWYIFTDNGAEGAYRSGPYKTKTEACYNFCSPIHMESKGVYHCHRSYITTGKTAIETGFSEWCYELDEDGEIKYV